MQLDARFPVIPVRGLANAGHQALPATTRPKPCDRFQAGELTKEAAQLAIEHFWAGALRRAVIDGDVENGSVMAGQSVGMVTREQTTAEIIAELVGQAVAAPVDRVAGGHPGRLRPHSHGAGNAASGGLAGSACAS